MPDHVVGDQRQRDAAFVQFPGRQARALQVRPRLRHSTCSLWPCSTATRITPSAVPMPAVASAPALHCVMTLPVGRHEFRAEAADGLVRGPFFGMDCARFVHHGARELRPASVAAASCSKRRFMRSMAQNRSTAVGRVSRNRLADPGNSARRSSSVRGVRTLDAQRDAHRRGHADRRRAADHHVLDRGGHVAIVGVGVADHFARQAALVEHDHALAGPFDGLCDIHRAFEFPP